MSKILKRFLRRFLSIFELFGFQPLQTISSLKGLSFFFIDLYKIKKQYKNSKINFIKLIDLQKKTKIFNLSKIKTIIKKYYTNLYKLNTFLNFFLK